MPNGQKLQQASAKARRRKANEKRTNKKATNTKPPSRTSQASRTWKNLPGGSLLTFQISVPNDPHPVFHFAIWDPTLCTDYLTAGHIIHLTDSTCPQGKGWVGRHTIEFYLKKQITTETVHCFATPLKSPKFSDAFLATARSVHSQHLPFAKPATTTSTLAQYKAVITQPQSLATIFPRGMMCWHFILACLQATATKPEMGTMQALLPNPLTNTATQYYHWVHTSGSSVLQKTIELAPLTIAGTVITAQEKYYENLGASAKRTARKAAPPASTTVTTTQQAVATTTSTPTDKSATTSQHTKQIKQGL